MTPPALLGLAPPAIGMSHAVLLRAAGDTRTVTIASVTSDYVLLIPLGRYLGVHTDSASRASTRPGRPPARCAPSSSCRATEGVSGYRHGPARSPRESRSTRPRHRAGEPPRETLGLNSLSASSLSVGEVAGRAVGEGEGEGEGEGARERVNQRKDWYRKRRRSSVGAGVGCRAAADSRA